MGKYLALLRKTDASGPVESKPKFVFRVVQKQPDKAAALALLERLKAYMLPSGRMAAARIIVERLRPMLAANTDIDLVEAAALLADIEAELNQLGGRCDVELAEAIAVVTRTFPGARLVS
jgi:hypothetical protein